MSFSTFLIALALGGCGSKTNSQDIVRGKDFALPRAEYAHVMAQLPPMPESRLKEARKEVLNRLIDEKLLANAAIKDGLDRQGDTVLQIEAARQSVLARAYLAKLTRSVAHPSGTEVSSFYRKNPDLFANRVEASFEQTSFAGDPKVVNGYRAMLARDSTALPELVRRAADDNVMVDTVPIQKSSDKLPPATATRLKTAKVGDNFLNARDGFVELISIREIRPAPLTLTQARPLIEAMLIDQRKNEIAKSEVARMRQAAQLSILDPQLAQ